MDGLIQAYIVGTSCASSTRHSSGESADLVPHEQIGCVRAEGARHLPLQQRRGGFVRLRHLRMRQRIGTQNAERMLSLLIAVSADVDHDPQLHD